MEHTATPEPQSAAKQPRTKKKRACVGCHDAKVRCEFSTDGQTKCDRCIDKDLECVLHVSRQGQKSKKNSNSSVQAGAAPFGVPVMGMEGCQPMGIMYLQGVPYLCAPVQVQHASFPVTRLQSAQIPNPAVQVLHCDTQVLPTSNQFLLPSNYQNAAMSNTAVTSGDYASIGNAMGNSSLNSDLQATSLASVVGSPIVENNVVLTLRQWIQIAMGSSCKPSLSKEYINSCLQIALSLSRQISDAEELKSEKLSRLPSNVTDWAAEVRVKIRRNGTLYEEVEGKGMAEGVSMIQAQNIYAIESAEIISGYLSGCKTSEDDRLACLAQDTQRQRIHAMGLLFYELFAGGKKAQTHNAITQSVTGAKLSTTIDDTIEAQSMDEKVTAFLEDFEKKTAVNASSNDFVWSDSEEGDDTLLELGTDENIDEGLGAFAQTSPCTHIGLNFSDENFDEVDKELKAFSQPFPPLGNGLDLSNALKLDNTIGDEWNPQDIDSSHHNSARKKLQQSNPSTELLSRIGLYTPLCYLIHNMLDCINGDLSGDEAYCKMADVTSELQLMIDQPKTYLTCEDSFNRSSFQLKEDLFMRDEEYAALIEAYRRSKTGSSELAVVSGNSGVGKSFLVSRLGRFIHTNNGDFISVKFDQRKDSNPLAALISAFNDYCAIFLESHDVAQIELLASMLQEALGRDDMTRLIKIMPNLSRIMGDNSFSASRHSCVNEEKKMGHIITRFVDVISSLSAKMLTLCLDDIHWADSFSLAILEQIIMMPASNKRIFLIGCYRDDELEPHHPFMKMMENCVDYETELTKVHLDCVDRDTVNHIVSNLLSLPPRLVKSLSDVVFQKSKGLPLYIDQLLVALKREGLLRQSLRKKRWIWDEEQIQARQLPNDVATFFARCICNLPRETQKALQVLSCFGATVHCTVLELLGSSLETDLITSLQAALDEGFLTKRRDRYSFAHDKIKEATYNTIGLCDCPLLHFSNGMKLIKAWSAFSTRALSELQDDELLFSAVSQLNLAGPLVHNDAKVSADVAEYNLVAAKKAMAPADFSRAASFLSYGIAFLNEDSWTSNYKLSLELHELHSKCSLVIGDFDALTKVSNAVLEKSFCFEDKLATYLVVMASLAYASKISDAINMGFDILAHLGHQFPINLTEVEVLSWFKRTRQELNGVSEEAWLNHKGISISRHQTAMEVLAKLQLIMYQAKPDLQPVATLEILNITVQHGISPMSICGLAYFAGMLAKLGEMRDAYRYAKLAKRLLDSCESKEIAGAVTWMTSEVLSFFEPMLTVNEYRVQGQATASSVGDVDFACLLWLMVCSTMLASGVHLVKLKDECIRAARYMKGQKHLTSYYFQLHGNRTISILLGESDNEDLTECRSANPHELITFYWMRMFTSVIMNEYEDTKYFTEKFLEIRTESWLLLSNQPRHEFYSGLASYRIYRATGDTLWLERARQGKANITHWSENGSLWNFEHLSYLLAAEDYYCSANLVEAKDSFEKAIAAARVHKYVNDEALAYECAGYFYLTAGMKAEALEYFVLAHKRYNEWGATAKAKKIFEFLPETCDGESSS